MHAHAAEDGWKITATDFAAEEYFGATLANGQLGIRPGKEPFSISAVLLNHVFDFSEGAGVNTVMPGPVPFGLSMKVDGKQGWEVSQWQQTVDMLDAEHITSFIADGKVKVTYIVRALRNMPFCVTMDVEAEALKPVTLEFENTPALPPDWTDVKRTDRSFKADLAYYSTRIDMVDGPAITWGMFAAQYARLGDTKAADEFFRLSPPMPRDSSVG